MRVLASDARSWAALAVISLVVGLIGPFDSFRMPPLPRIGYWTAVVVISAVIGTLVAGLIERLIGPRLPRLVSAALAGAIAGIPIALLVILLNVAVFGLWFQPIDAISLGIYCTLISGAITVLSAVFERPAAAPAAATSSPALLDRLALPQRGRLLHLAVADHYVEVTTDRGRALLLLRLSDAIRETAPVKGIQVHRSHWVALDAVRSGARRAGKPVLELENGTIVPISRSCLAEVKAAGLL